MMMRSIATYHAKTMLRCTHSAVSSTTTSSLVNSTQSWSTVHPQTMTRARGIILEKYNQSNNLTSQYRCFSSAPTPEDMAPNSDETVPEDKKDNKDEIISNFQKEVKDLKERYLRSLAEEENVRRIAKRDVANAKEYANTSFAKALLNVADNLERALSTIPQDKRNSDDPTLKSLIEGIEMTEKNLQKVFQQFHIVRYGAVDDVFDPNIHDALFQIPDPEKESGTIGQVLEKGYKLKDRVIRAAQVGTRTKP
eukprot:gene8498-11489_t